MVDIPFAKLLLGFAPLFWIWISGQAVGQSSTPAGFRQYDGKHITLITDLPHSAPIGELPLVFDSAVPMWGEYFGIDRSEWSQWKCTCYLIGDRNRFQEAGYISTNLPPFVHGYQLGDDLWCMEQPSEYYRRHLLLHEGTHWFMNRALENPGPPWYMEGMAEKLGTHQWTNGKLQLNVFPDRRDGFEYWGRMLLIKKQRGTSEAPTLEGILRYGDTAHQQVEAYAWSWAALWFLSHHPRSADVMKRLQTAKISDTKAFTPKLLTQLRPHWGELTMSWNAWVQQLDYGGDVDRDIPLITTEPAASILLSRTMKLRVDQGWQDSGLRVLAGDRLSIKAQGRFQVGSEPEPWWCEPGGVTIEYFGGQPLGKVLGLIVAEDTNRNAEPSKTEFMAVGEKLEYSAQQAGALMFRINEPSGRLRDNQGFVEVSIEIQRK